jgi:hypothetical protein
VGTAYLNSTITSFAGTVYARAGGVEAFVDEGGTGWLIAIWQTRSICTLRRRRWEARDGSGANIILREPYARALWCWLVLLGSESDAALAGSRLSAVETLLTWWVVLHQGGGRDHRESEDPDRYRFTHIAAAVGTPVISLGALVRSHWTVWVRGVSHSGKRTLALLP